MKKIRLLLMVFSGLLLALFATGQTGLTFKLTNPRLVFTGTPQSSKLRFDIQVKASTSGSFLWSGQAVLAFDNSTLSIDAADWAATQGAILQTTYFDEDTETNKPKYPVFVYNVVGGVFYLTWGATSANDSKEPSATYFSEISTNWQTIATITCKIATQTPTLAGITFVSESMATQQFYHSGIATNVNYSPINYEGDFANLYAGRIFSTYNNSWSQIGGAVDWETAVNTSVWDGNATLPDDAESKAVAVRIHSGATLTVPPTGQLTAESIENNMALGLNIQSDASNTGSVITSTATGSGTATMQRYMAEKSWRIAASPLAGQQIGAFITANPNVATHLTTPSLRGMTDYAMATNTWNAYFTEGTTENIEVGKGYMLRAKTGGAGAMTFTGSLTAGDINIGTTAAGLNWNCIGNPYTAAVPVDVLINNNFNEGVSSSFESSYEAVYVFDGNEYEILNLSSLGNPMLQAGQGFFIKRNSNSSTLKTTVDFTTAMLVHDNAAVLKSEEARPEIKLLASNSNNIVSTSIRFITGTSIGFDRGYDAGAFKADLPVSVYTKLIVDNGIEYGIQCLPDAGIDEMIIPVGIESKDGGTVVFSAETISLPSDFKVVLEDKLLNKFTDLNENVYSAEIEASTNTSDRFQLHASYNTTDIDANDLMSKITAHAIRNVELIINGDVTNDAVATLYDVQGRKIITRRLNGGNYNSIELPMIKTGVYLLYVNDSGRQSVIKVPVNE